jgi:dienelactone hydrolase
MTKFTKSLMVILVIIFSVTLANAGNSYKTETIKFKSNTVYTYRDFLDGLDDAKEVKISGKLIIPESSDKVPAMIFLHDQGGITRRTNYWVKAFNSMGVATFQIDSYKGRGVTPGRGAPSKVQSMTMIIDAYKGLELLANNPKIDSSKIGVMGFCISGVSSIMAAWEPVRKVMGELKFASHIALYPLCFDFETFNLTGAPILIITGGKDEWMPATTCLTLGDRLRETGYPIQNIVYPEASHLFDDTRRNVKITIMSLLKCSFLMKDDGTQVNTVCNLDDSDKDYITCCKEKKTISIGYNKEAREGSMIEVKSLITKVFQLKSVVEKVIEKAENSNASTDR